MLIIGAKGLAKEILEIYVSDDRINQLAFYDDVNTDVSEKLFGKYPILRSLEEAKKFFELHGNDFTLGLGNPFLRWKIFQRFKKINGRLVSSISNRTFIGSHDVSIGDGCSVLSGVNISNSVQIGEGCLIYYNAVITHDCQIGDFVEISPSANILGRTEIASYTHIGTNATIFPDLKIGRNVVVGAGAVVRENVPDNCMVAGIPAVIKNKRDPINFEVA